MSKQHLQKCYKVKRDFTDEEQKWLNKLMSIDFPGREILKNQINQAKVTGSCLCGCKSISLHIERLSPQFPYPIRVPIEMMVYEDKSAPIIFYLHVVGGYVAELEVFRADSTKIEAINSVDNAKININLSQLDIILVALFS